MWTINTDELPLVGDRNPMVLGALNVGKKTFVLTDAGVFVRYGEGWGRYQYPVTIGGFCVEYHPNSGLTVKTADKEYAWVASIHPLQDGRHEVVLKGGQRFVI